MKLFCPSCKTPIAANQLNVQTDVALCEDCGETYSISELLAQGQSAADIDVSHPPRGTWIEDHGDAWSVGATTRSAAAFFLVPFLSVWSGISLGGIYGTQIAKGEFNLLLSLFGIPFVLGTIILGSIAALTMCGKVALSADRDDGRVFTGVGPFGRTRRFEWSAVTGVQEAVASYGRRGGPNLAIQLQGPTPLTFGTMLSEERRHYLIQVLRQRLASRRK